MIGFLVVNPVGQFGSPGGVALETKMQQKCHQLVLTFTWQVSHFPH